MMKGNAFKAVVGVSGALTVVGFVSWALVLNASWSVGLTDYVAWGLAIAAFLVLEAFAAGALLFASFGEDMFVRKRLASVSIAASVGCVAAIVYDLGSPTAFWRLFFAPHFQAPMALDVWFFSLAIVLGAVYLFALVKNKAKAVAVLSKVTLVVSLLLPFGTSILFTTVIARTGWTSPLEMVVFVIGAVMTGVCLVVLMSKESRETESAKTRTLMAVLLGANACLIAAELVQGMYTTGFGFSNLFALATGSYAWMYWIWLVGGIALPLILLAFNVRQKIVAAIAVAGMAMGKYVYMVKGSLFAYVAMGQGVTVPALDGVPTGQVLAPAYVPGLGEWGISIGSVALAVLIGAILVHKVAGARQESAHAQG